MSRPKPKRVFRLNVVTHIVSLTGEADGMRTKGRDTTGTHAGTAYTLHFDSSKGTSLQVACRRSSSVKCFRRNALDRMAQRCMPHVSYSSGDPDFDARCQVNTLDPEFARRWMHSAQVRATILALIEDRGHVSLVSDKLVLEGHDPSWRGADAAERVHASVERLALLATAIETAHARSLGASPVRDWLRVGLIVLACLTGAAFLVFAFSAVRAFKPPGYLVIVPAPRWLILGGGALCSLASLPLLAFCLRRRTAPWRDLQAGVLLCGLLGSLAILPPLLTYDRLGATAPLEEFVLRFAAVKEHENDKGELHTDLYLDAMDAATGEERSYRFRMLPGAFAEARLHHDLVKLRLQRGALGWVRHAQPPELIPTGSPDQVDPPRIDAARLHEMLSR